MDFELTNRQREFRDRVKAFVDDEIRPHQTAHERHVQSAERWNTDPVVEELKRRARATGLWNLFMPPRGDREHVDDTFKFEGEHLSNLEYALCAEEMGRIKWASEVFNCNAPDTGNMEVLERYGTRAQKDRWLAPLMRGEIRSAFLMTEPDVASSDATNISTSILRDGDDYVINGRKWWSSGAAHPNCQVAIVMGKSDPEGSRHGSQSMILVPMDTPGVKVERSLSVFGYDHAPHGHAEVSLENVRVPADNIILGEGRGFEIAQGRLGPGRLHHCMRVIGQAEEALEAMCRRLTSRFAFGKRISDQSVWEERVARARVDIETSRLLCLRAADILDRYGNKDAKVDIAMIKLQAPSAAIKIIDDAIQAHGGAGVSSDFGLAASWAHTRTLRISDGPDEAHARTIARAEFGKYADLKKRP